MFHVHKKIFPDIWPDIFKIQYLTIIHEIIIILNESRIYSNIL